tara:strand:+ start:30 stop:746 length:717 start_codon:yes stop_codon:yes gene_type:complete
MALDFAAQIHALTGFDADSTNDTETGDDFNVLAAQWMNDATREVANLLPPNLLERVSKVSSAFAPNTGIDIASKVLSVIRTRNTEGTPQFDNPGDVFVCRQIPHSLSHKALDPDSLEYATETDPVYYIEPQVDDTAAKIKILPASTANIAKVSMVDYPVWTTGSGTYQVTSATSINNFPDEAEYLVVLRASIYAAEYQAVIEEDPELYLPIIQNLKQDYMQGLQALGVVQAQPQQAGR